MRISPVSMTNQYRTNRSNTKQVKSPSFGYSIPPDMEKTFQSCAKYICHKEGKEACEKYIQKVNEFISKKLDLTDLYNKYLSEFKKYGKESSLNKIMSKLNGSLNQVEIEMGKVKKRRDYCATSTKIDLYEIECWSGDYRLFKITYTTPITVIMGTIEGIENFCKTTEERIKKLIANDCDEKLREFKFAEEKKQLEQSQKYVDKLWKKIFKNTSKN